MTRLVFITPKVDPADDLFGHIHGWVSALAARVERLHVITLWDSAAPLPANVTLQSMGKGRGESGGGGASKAVWLVSLQRHLLRALRRGQADAVVSHMGPIFAVAAAPLARLTRTPGYLWYAHGHVSPMLRLAYALVDGVATSTPEGFRIRGARPFLTGQGIDTRRFAPRRESSEGGGLLSVGRYSPIKDYETLIDAVALLPAERRPRVTVVGGAHSAGDRSYRAALARRAERSSLGETVTLCEGRPYWSMPTVYQDSGLFATCSRTGSLDKAVLESIAAGVPPLVCNPAFRALFGDLWPRLSFQAGDARALAERLNDWLTLDGARRRAAIEPLGARVQSEHSVEHWADRMVAMVGAAQA
ncbi:MAG: glycosyltransferase family 4 protein [Chloroflexota bacterium]